MPTGKGCRPSWLEDKISDGFAAYGRFACRHPLPLIILPLVTCACFGVGLVRLRALTDTEEVYTPMESLARQYKAKTLSIFPDTSADSFQSHNSVTLGRYVIVMGRMKTTDENVLTTSSLDEVERLHSFLKNLTVTADGRTYGFTDLCGRAFGECVVGGSYLLSSDFRIRVETNNVTYPYIHTTTRPIEVDGFLGDVTASGGIVRKARYFSLRYNFRQDQGMDAGVTAMEDKFIEELKKFESNGLELAFSMSRSLGEELNKSILGDIVFFSLTFTLMIMYVSHISHTHNMVASHANLSRLGVVSTGMGLVGGLGLVSASGLDYVALVGATPFLIIGVGIDDIFVLVSGLADTYELTQEEQDHNKGVETRIAETMRTSGVAITVTTATNVVALAIGASSVFLGVRNFSVYTGACFLLAYINHLTFFTGLMVLHERRLEASRHEMLCWRTIGTREEAADRSWWYRLCCTGFKPRNRDDAENVMERIPRIVTTKIVSLLPARIFIILAFFALIGVSIWGVTQFSSGLELSQLAVDGSYYKTFDKWKNAYFIRQEPVSIVIESPVDYHSGTVQLEIDQLVANLKKDSITGIDDKFEINWLKDYRKFPYYPNSSSTSFVQILRTQFLKFYPHFKHDIVFSSDNTTIKASRVYVRTKNLKSSERQAESMAKIREIVSASPLPVYATSPGAVFYEQFLLVTPSTFQTVGVAVGVVFVVTCLFMPSLVLIVHITVALAVSMVELFAFMHFWGLTLNSITMIQIIMSVGFSVDYESHICHAYLVAPGSSRQEKVVNALNKVSGPITHGAGSSVLGLLTLIVSKSFIFRSFFKVMLLVLVFGFIQSLFVIPAFLYYTGPRASSDSQTRVEDQQMVENQDTVEQQNGVNREVTEESTSVPKSQVI